MFRIGNVDWQIHLQGFCNRPANRLGHGNLLFRLSG
jgi:hypothetical protein